MEAAEAKRPTRRRGEGRVFQHPLTGGWFIAFYWQGREVRLSAAKLVRKHPQDVTEADAIRALRQKVAEVRLERYKGPEAERLTIGELLSDYERHLALRGVNRDGNEAKFDRVRADLGHGQVRSLTVSGIERWTADLLKHYAPGTVNVILGVLRAALHYGRKAGRLGETPFVPALRVDNVRRVFFEREEVEHLVAGLPQPLDDLVRFAYLTGWRRGEICGLAWGQVDRQGGVITLERSKNGHGRTIPLVGELAALIERQWARRVVGATLSRWVFHRRGQPIRWIAGPWAVACGQAGIVGKRFHDLRRTAIRDMVRAGVPETVAMSISGHRSRSIFDRYNVSDERDRGEALRRVEGYRAAQEARVIALTRTAIRCPQ